MTKDTYQHGFQDGLAAAVTLVRAGASGDDLAVLLPADPAQADPRGYSDRLGELRAILDTTGLFTGAAHA
jgi:hypothetical protein